MLHNIESGSYGDQPVNLPPQSKEEGELAEGQRPIKFRSNIENWREQPDAPQAKEEIEKEYDSATLEMRLLSEATDAAAIATYHRLLLQQVYPQNLWTLRPYDDTSINLKEIYNSAYETESPHDHILSGYHPHGKYGAANGFGKVIDTARTLDIVDQNKGLSEEEIKQKIYNSTVKEPGFEGFTAGGIKDIFQYGSTYLAVIDDEYWNRHLHGITCFNLGNYLFTSETNLQNPHMGILLIHEFSHMIDSSADRKWSSKEREANNDRMIRSLKTEFSAFLITFPPETTIQTIVDRLRIAYLPMYINDFGSDSERKFNAFANVIVKINPYIRGMILEMGEDLNDVWMFNLTLRTFISSLPDREACFRLLNDATGTGVYAEGLKH